MINMRHSKKGITPIISIIILLGITVALAGLAWTVLYNYIGIYTEKTFDIPFDGGVYCSKINDQTTIRVFIRNTGTAPLVESDFSMLQIDGVDIYPSGIPSGGSIASGEAGFLIDNYTGTGNWSAGAHTIDITTTTGTIKHEIVYCS